MLNLPLLSVGAVGFVSVVGHVVTPELRSMLDAYVSGDVQKATEIHQKLLPVFTGMFRTQGVMTTKAALALQGLPAGPLRAPMVELSPEETTQLKIDLAAGGVEL
jgi:4-hydroxy-tetrahydrodipicolinate synthase